MTDGIIYPSKDDAFGFTPDAWSADSYLWKEGKRVWISLVIAKVIGGGALTALFKSIEDAGFEVAVPTPLGRMTQILLHKGFVRTYEDTKEHEGVEVWLRPKPKKGKP